MQAIILAIPVKTGDQKQDTKYYRLAEIDCVLSNRAKRITISVVL